jgi:hypothetical protein
MAAGSAPKPSRTSTLSGGSGKGFVGRLLEGTKSDKRPARSATLNVAPTSKVCVFMWCVCCLCMYVYFMVAMCACVVWVSICMCACVYVWYYGVCCVGESCRSFFFAQCHVWEGLSCVPACVCYCCDMESAMR